MDTQTHAPSLAHLMAPPQYCQRCGHMALLHWRSGGHCASVTDCLCPRDPVCSYCGQLTSKHDLLPEAQA
jgi:hypothetical protein